MNTTNLLQLAAFLETVPEPKFTMRSFCTNGYHDLAIEEHNCGTAGCAVGYGPRAGLKITEDDANWYTYSERVFGFNWDDPEWEWCFSADWMDIDNTPLGAAKRIRYCVTNGVPEGWQSSPVLDDVRIYQ